MGINIIQNVNDINSPFLGAVLILLIAFPEIIVKLISLSKNKLKIGNKALEIIKYALLILIGCLMATNRNYADIAKANFWFGFSMMWYILYIEIFIKYLIKGRVEKVMYSPFLYLKVPAHIFSSLSLIFINVWSKHYLLVALSVVYGIVSVVNAYKLYMRDFTEYRDLYDENRKLTGKRVLKGDKVLKGMYTTTVAVLMYSPKYKKYLMQKRTPDKGGYWGTTSGHPKSGENSLEGMVTEIHEELGITVDKNELKLIDTLQKKNKFVDIYYLEKDVEIEDCNIQLEELTELTYMNKKEVEKFYEAGKFKKTHYQYFLKLIDKINKK